MTGLEWPYHLRRGHSENPTEGACAMDAVNWLVHGKHGDYPRCVSPVIRAFVLFGNDSMSDDTRQRLLSYLHRISGSRSPAHEAARLRIMVLGAVRIFAPRALDAAGMTKQADILRSLPDDVTFETARAAAEEAAEAAAPRAAWTAARAVAEVVAAEEVLAGGEAAWAAIEAAAWDDYFAVRDAALRAGPEGEPWSADAITLGVSRYDAAREHAVVA